jgi:hypothetical protein
MHQDTHSPDVPLPSAQLLMQRRVGDDLAIKHCEHRQIAAQIDVLAPFVNHSRIRDTMLDEHPLVGGDREEEFVESHLVRYLKRANDTFETAL